MVVAMSDEKCLVLTADEIIGMWELVDGDIERFRKLFDYLTDRPNPSRTYEIHEKRTSISPAERLAQRVAVLPDDKKPTAANLLKSIDKLLEKYPDGIELGEEE